MHRPNTSWSLTGTGLDSGVHTGLHDGHSGTVVFVVRGDNRELFRSPLVKDQALRKLDVDVQGVRLLVPSVEDGEDGTDSDWGVWMSPQIQRSAKEHQ